MRTTTVSDPSRQGAAPESGGDVLFGASSGCPPVSSTLPGEAQPVIEVHDLTKRYGTHTIHEHLDLTVGQSEIIALVGGSGSGKTTLIRQIIGLEAPTSGHIRIFGHDITMIDRRAAHVEFGVVPRGAELVADAGPFPELGDGDVGIFEIARVEHHALPIDFGVAHLEARRKGIARSAGHAAAMR